jgi:hypothetical protein
MIQRLRREALAVLLLQEGLDVSWPKSDDGKSGKLPEEKVLPD